MPFAATTGFAFSEFGIATYAPRKSGVYGIYNGTTWIYVGEAQDIEARLYEHRRGQSDQSSCILRQVPTHFLFEECTEAVRKLREATLRRELSPICNKT
jgi:excinuclease UvrABC nuclease subunit